MPWADARAETAVPNPCAGLLLLLGERKKEKKRKEKKKGRAPQPGFQSEQPNPAESSAQAHALLFHVHRGVSSEAKASAPSNCSLDPQTKQAEAKGDSGQAAISGLPRSDLQLASVHVV